MSDLTSPVVGGARHEQERGPGGNGGITLSGMTGEQSGLAELASSEANQRGATSNEMIYRPLGRTGEKVSAIGLGGHHIGRPKDPAEGIAIIRSAIDRGVTFMDNCWDYHDGESERRMGQALQDGYRKRVFLMTKFDGRTKASTARQIDQSLERLQTDSIDLVQYHENIRMEDPDRFFAAAIARSDPGPPAEDETGGDDGPVRTVQNKRHVRWHRAQSPVDGVSEDTTSFASPNSTCAAGC